MGRQTTETYTWLFAGIVGYVEETAIQTMQRGHHDDGGNITYMYERPVLKGGS